MAYTFTTFKLYVTSTIMPQPQYYYLPSESTNLGHPSRLNPGCSVADMMQPSQRQDTGQKYTYR